MNKIRFEVSVRTCKETSVSFNLYDENSKKIDTIASKCFKKSTMLIFNVSKKVHSIKPYITTVDIEKTRLWKGPFKNTVIKGLEVKPNIGNVHFHDFHQGTKQKMILN